MSFSCCKQQVIKEYVYVPVKDTIEEANNITRIMNLERELSLARDSIKFLQDSASDELIVAKIKLARIKEYNRIAGNGNNITFLRGWINRVLDE